MRYLLDTHTFLWWNLGSPQLSLICRALVEDQDNEIYLSAGSAWEIAIKVQIGKLALPESPNQYVLGRAVLNGFRLLPIAADHALDTYALPLLHRDPFDRILVAQSRIEGLPILTADPLISQYEVKTIW